MFNRSHILSITLMFVASGFAGLVYQSVWSQYLGLLLGHAAYAQALVLAIFMGGMALGSLWASRRISAVGRPMRRYGQVEAVIGIAGIVFHVVFVGVSGWLFGHVLPAIGSPLLSGLLCWLIAALLILPQTVLLGTTFPLMSSALIRAQPERSGSILGWLYFLNSIGAALGALFATFLIVPQVGLPGAMILAGGLNIGIFIATLLLREDARPAQASTPRESTGGQRSALLRVILVAAALTGLSSFMYEIGWIRMLSMVLGSSLHSFEIMLAAFIGGLAFGGLAVRRWLVAGVDSMRLVGWIQIAMGCCALLTLLCYGSSFGWVSWLLQAIARTEPGYALFNIASAGIAMVIMLPAAFFAGMTLPALTFILLRSSGQERSIGQVYAVNTLGAIAGVFLMIHVAMPLLGLKLGMIVAGSIDLALGIYLISRSSANHAALLKPAMVSLVAVSVALLWADFDPRKLASGVYRSGQASVADSAKVFYSADGKTASVALVAHADGLVSIRTNGKPDAALQMIPGRLPGTDEPTMILAGALGFAYKPDALDVGIIGFGSGLTTHTVAGVDGVRAVETIEIEREMISAARYYGARVERAFSDPRSSIIIDDARAFFSSAHRQYDLIISEPSNPWVAGVAKLFSREFYAFVPRHLTDEGLLVQWIHIYEIDTRTVLSMLAALDASFTDYHIYLANEADLIIVASAHRKLPELKEGFLSSVGLRELAEYISIRSTDDLRLRRALSAADVRAMLRVAPVSENSDFYPFVTYQAPVDRFVGAKAVDFMMLPVGPGSVLALLAPPEDAARAAGTPTPVPHHLVSRRLLGRAVALALSDPDEPVAAEAATAISDLRELGAGCFQGRPESESLDVLLDSFELTAFAERDLFAQSWRSPHWLVCGGETTLPETVAGALEVFESISRGDAKEQSQVLLRLGALSQRTQQGWVALALYSLRDSPSDVRALWAEYQSVLKLDRAERMYFDTIVERLAGPGGDAP